MTTPADNSRTLPFDAGALTEPVDPVAVRAFAKHLRDSGAVPGMFSGSVGTIIGAIVLILFLGSTLLFGGGVVITTLLVMSDGNALSVPVILAAVIVIGIIVLVVVLLIRQYGRTHARWFRLSRFAQANGMSYLPRLDSPPLPGMIFQVGSSRRSDDLVRGERPRFVEFGNYQYTTGSGKNRTTHKWGYVAVKLDVPLPNIVLDATSNNGLFGTTNLPASFSKDQRLSLEGNFDDYFALYCPQGYEADALYLFTPDIMARFIDNAAAMDVEIVDDWLFLYGKREFSGLDPATWAWLFSVVGALLDKFAQWARWRDDRLAQAARQHAALQAPPTAPAVAPGTPTAAPGTPAAAPGTPPAAAALPFAPPPTALRPPPGVALQGRRLKRRTSWVAIVVLGLFLIIWFMTQSGFITLLLAR